MPVYHFEIVLHVFNVHPKWYAFQQDRATVLHCGKIYKSPDRIFSFASRTERKGRRED